MKQYILFVFFVSVLFILVKGQPQICVIKTIKETNLISKEVYVFPKIFVPNNTIVSKKINNTLLEFLEIENGFFKKSIFENIGPPLNENYGLIYTDLNFKVLINTQKILAIHVWASFGKHNTENTERFVFDIKTGKRITIDTLINKAKKKALVQFLYNKKKSLIQKFIASTKDSLIVHKQRGDSANYERDLYQLEAYPRCIEESNFDEESLKYFRFYLQNNKIHFILGNCFPWATICYDDLGDFHFEFTLEELKPYLSLYAQKLLGK